MADIKQTVTRTEDNGLTSDGASMQQQTEQVHTETHADAQTTARNLIWYILGFIEILLAARFVFKLFGANVSSAFVETLYNVTDVLTAPFDQIFGVTAAQAGETESVFEPSILVAMAVYAVIAWGIVRLITLNRNPE